MKIIHTIFSFHVGGAETMLVDILNRQCKDASVSLIIVNNKINADLLTTIDERVTVFLLNRKERSKIQLLPAFLKINRIVSKIKPDIIHCHDNKLFPFFFRWKRKTCLTVHSVNLSVAFLKYYRQIFAISAAVQQNIKELTGLNAQVVFNGIEIDQYLSRTNYDFDAEKNEFKIIQISRLLPEQKGQHIAIRAMRLLKEQNPDLKIKLYFVGGGDALTELETLAVQNDVRDDVVFEGTVDREWIKNNLQNYHVLIQPSLIEGFGLTIIEGFACGLPVITSNLNGPEEICRLLNAGLLIQANDSVDLAEKTVEVYQSYVSGTLKNNSFILRDKNRLKIFDIQTTVKLYMNHYVL